MCMRPNLSILELRTECATAKAVATASGGEVKDEGPLQMCGQDVASRNLPRYRYGVSTIGWMG